MIAVALLTSVRSLKKGGAHNNNWRSELCVGDSVGITAGVLFPAAPIAVAGGAGGGGKVPFGDPHALMASNRKRLRSHNRQPENRRSAVQLNFVIV